VVVLAGAPAHFALVEWLTRTRYSQHRRPCIPAVGIRELEHRTLEQAAPRTAAGRIVAVGHHTVAEGCHIAVAERHIAVVLHTLVVAR